MLGVESGLAPDLTSGPPRRSRARADRGPGLLDLDPIALLAVAVLVGAGLLNLLAIGRSDLAIHQLVAVGAGLALLFLLLRSDIHSLPLLGRGTYGVAIAMLLAVFLAGAHAYGA